ncbi:serine hydrolase [Aureibacter tunicatorum]|uniref:CubicO group peptidase (Beta-lactamase class C family) n=1 Tax=Aureibacter tunicatorum TaxID=866807 RepID=A0AAE4BTX6_9BACT|nr:serine hydrolase [Aureibacter tunicatorum]MDR6241196.1 CubicO group peptidase (beta-lactamase class C family) [Aureibacter tunicatorum]BDD03971.1 hypothetical protein AUTU_14540 [Aureibacter tunicatorum]
MKHQFYSLIVLLLIFASCSSGSKKQLDKITIQSQQLDSLFNFCYSNGMYNGAVIVTKNDSVIYKNSFGYANEENKEKITPESVFYIASVSKQFTSMGIMILSEQGKLSFDDKIEDIFPNYPAYLKNITIRQLMTHTSGITDTELYKLKDPSNDDVLESIMKGDSLELENGKTFRYSNTGYTLLAFVIEKVSGMPIEEFFEKEIFDPLNMRHTTTSIRRKQNNMKTVIGYNWLGKNGGYNSTVVGGGGIYSTINDLQKYNKALNTNKLVTKNTLNKAFTNGQLSDQESDGYGFGWSLREKDNKKYVQHDGYVPGYRSFIKKNLTDGYDYIFLTNHGDKLPMNELISSIDSVLEQSKYVRPKNRVVNKISHELKVNGSSNLCQNIKDEIIKNKDHYTIDENRINLLGYMYLRDNQTNIAIEIFKLNTYLHPNSANVWDSLGEGYYENGQFELSKENYQKTLEMNPDNDNARVVIERIEKGQTKNS